MIFVGRVRVTLGIGDAFGPVEEEIVTASLPELFKGVGDGAPGREITRLPEKQAGVLCHHRTSSFSTLGTGDLPDGGPCGLPPGWKGVGKAE